MSFGGFNFGTPKTTAPTAGAGGFSFTSPAPLGQTAAPAANKTVGFNFGATPAATTAANPTTGFSFGTPATTSVGTGLTLGTATTQSMAGFGLATPASTATPGFGLAAPASTQSTPGFGLATPASTATGLFGSTPASTASTGLGGFGFAKPTAATTAAPTLSLGGLGKPALSTATTTTATGLGFGTGLKLGGTSTGFPSTSLPAAGTSIFNQSTVKTTTTGLGGVDPKTSTSTASTAADGTKTSEGKTGKEQMVEPDIMADIEKFKVFVKEEKTEEEHIKRLSSTPMMKVQEDNTALKHLLATLTSGLQRNVCAVDKLKREMTQELKNAEMAIRTKEIPVGLQYENTAPTQYFQYLVESFENQMLSYRQQIEMLESHLASIHQPNRLTSDELVLLLRKLHEAFIAMAAQLQQVHEAVKTQKEHYLNYRKVFLGDSRNIFERQKKAAVRVTPVHHQEYGQSPFPGLHDAAAVAMASTLNRTQQPAGQTGAPPVTGFGQSTGLGTNPGFGSFGTTTTGFKGFGGGSTSTSGGLFGSTATTQSTGIFNSSFPAPATAQPALNLSTATEQPFQLNKPPVGSKRGKR